MSGEEEKKEVRFISKLQIDVDEYGEYRQRMFDQLLGAVHEYEVKKMQVIFS